jgi:4,5-DOPA dioxygenase extradiol
MPVLFLGHGSPMNALAENDFTKSLNQLGQKIPRPKAILCVSAHWQTEGTFVTSTDNPKQIYDFYGFPRELNELKYNAKGSQVAAIKVHSMIEHTSVGFDNGQWGIDHGTWSVLIHLYPTAPVPILQLSLDLQLSPSQHYELARELVKLREEGFLIVGSGNIVHNLWKIGWADDAPAHPWALQFDSWFKEKLLSSDDKAIVNDFKTAPGGAESVPTLEHYLPALYVLGARSPEDKLSFIYEGMQNASISMRSFLLDSGQIS